MLRLLVVLFGLTLSPVIAQTTPPSVADVDPEIFPTAGGTEITLTGSELGPQTIVLINGQICSNAVAEEARYRCTVPPGDAGPVSLWAVANGLPSAPVAVAYEGPRIETAEPVTVPRTGNVVLTLTGDNFGTQPTLLIGNVACPIQDFSHQQIECLVPPGTGFGLEVKVVAPSGVASRVGNPMFSYLPCPPGTFVNSADPVECLSCDPGFFSAQPNSPFCSQCPAGSYAANAGQTACDLCEPGRFQNLPGGQACQACPAGRFAPSAGSVACQSCEAGTFAPEPGAARCQSCSPGFFSANDAASECEPCATGTAQPASGSRSCNACPEGRFADTTGRASCSDCPAGTFSATSGASQCEACPEGTFNPFTGQARCAGAEACAAWLTIFDDRFQAWMTPP